MKVRIKNGMSAFVYNLFRGEGAEFDLTDVETVDGKVIKAKDQVSKTMEVIDAPKKKTRKVNSES